MHADVVVLGGGISGLTAAHSAQKAGASVLVLESRLNEGGVMQTDDQHGFLVEHGPTSMAATDPSLALLGELGLSGDVVRPHPAAARRYVVRNGRMHALPSSPATLFRSELLSTAGKLRALVEPFVAERSNTAPEESLAAIVRRRFGQEVLDYVIDPLVSGVCAGDPEKLSSRHVLRIVAELEGAYGSVLKGAIQRARNNRRKRDGHILSLRLGMHQLPHRLRTELGDSCVFNARVTDVRLSTQHVKLSCQLDGRSESILAGSIVCALPAHTLPSVVWPEDWRDHIDRMSAVHHAAIGTVALGFRRDDVSHPLDGFGVLIPSSEKREILGALFNSSMFEGRASSGRVLITAFVGGTRWTEGITGRNREFTDAVCVAAALQELTPLLGITRAPLMSSVARWKEGIPQLQVGHHEILTSAAAIENRTSRAFFTGSYLSGAAIGDCLAYSAAAGQRAAAAAMHQHSQVEKVLAQRTDTFL